jgi:hypothetical protein
MPGKFLLLWVLLFSFTIQRASQAQSQPDTDVPNPAQECPTNQVGIYFLQAKPMPLANLNPVKVKSARGFAASLSYGLVPAKVVAEYGGEHAPAYSELAQPIICIRHMISLPGDPVIVRLHAKKDSRELDGGRMTVYPVVGGSKVADANASDLIAVDVVHPEPTVWQIRLKSPLEPGEYALMLGTQNLSIFSFRIKAVVPQIPSSK